MSEQQARPLKNRVKSTSRILLLKELYVSTLKHVSGKKFHTGKTRQRKDVLKASFRAKGIKSL